MRRLSLAFMLLSLVGCTPKWLPPEVEAVEASDRRHCTPERRCVDVVVVVDTSASAADPPGIGEAGFGYMMRLIFLGPPEAGPGSTLWVGLDGIASALERLDPAKVGVALTAFAGYTDFDGGSGGESWVEVGVTDDYPVIGSALERLRARGARGSSCHACAVTLARAVLKGDRDDRCEALVLVGDVSPTQPHGPEADAANQREVVRALATTEITNFTIVSLGPANDPHLARMEQLLAPKWGVVTVATDASSVASAIVGAVETCE